MDIPPRNIHLVDRNKLTDAERDFLKTKGEAGAFSPYRQHIRIIRSPNESLLDFALTLVHEMIHANSFQSWQKTDDFKGPTINVSETETGEVTRLRPRRQGIGARKREDINLFERLDEAVISELTIRFDQEFFPQFDGIKKEITLRGEVFASVSSIEQRRKIKKIEKVSEEKGKSRFDLISYSYFKEREILRKIIREIFQKNSDQFSSEDEVFNLFVQSSMVGRLLPLARVYEKTFGPGSFKKIGQEMIKK